ncbi:PREDICTED: probable glycosyltransferase At3g07620 isoform X1 [Lupinus angustifolius]|nr:PREDICTED: probable glycosyltransferase At3g07620 isoform X1 [Lupinus angustifolius]
MGIISVLALRLRLYHLALLIVGMLVSTIVVFQCFGLSSLRILSVWDGNKLSIALPVDVFNVTNFMHNTTYEKEADFDHDLESNEDKSSRRGFHFEKRDINNSEVENHEDGIYSFTQKRPKYAHDPTQQDREMDNRYNIQGRVHDMQFASKGIRSKSIKNLDAGLVTSDLFVTGEESSTVSGTQSVEMQPHNEKSLLLKTPLPVLNNESKIDTPNMRRKLVWPTSITEMNSLLLQSFNSSMRPKWSSQRDRELLSAKLDIEKARIISNSSELYGPIFRDVSKFSRSYELMERKLKVYIYREGERPIFHQPKMRGLYASEGWFMKLTEGNKRFIVRDPRKAHLFYLPFSSQMLRVALSEQNLHSKQMEQYLERYVQLIAGKYRFWNRTEGADHFLVACHDWASKITRQPMKKCIRSLCNANIAKGFQIGKDTTLPVTYIHSMMDPLKDLARKPPSEKSILAFFAGGMHGYLRPILLKHWENKEPDMKIFGPMARDIEGKRIYREYMNSSKYCICARGYEVHTPRIVEAIFSGCVPVIISDNYVPPFFEVLNWEAFSVHVRESDIPRLRNILVSIPEEKYLALHLGVEKVQQHFKWHKIPVKYDLFHMILHSIWNNRLSQIRTR